MFEKNFYTGRESHKFVEKLIMGGEKILIISPYIDGHYAKYLRRNLGRKRIFILSSALTKDAKSILGRRDYSLHIVAAFFLIINYVLLLKNFFRIYFVFFSLSFVALAYLYTKFFKSGTIFLKVPADFVHAKMYLSENSAIQGSANLTYKGMHENVENIRLISDKKEIKELEIEFWKIWQSKTKS